MATAKQGKKARGITLTRIFDAPRSLVWKAWTDPELLKRWWGPRIFTAPVIKVDLRVGGKYLYAMRSPDGKDFWSTGTYRDIIPPERIVVTDSFSDEKGNVVPASYYGMTWDWPLEARVTSTFEEQKGKTKFTLLYEITPPKEMLEPMVAGWNESFDKLETVLGEEKARRVRTLLVAEPGKQEASVIRTFDAPREKLFRAYTDPNLMGQWGAPRRFTIVIEKLEARAGGSWRILNRDADGNEFWFHGVFHEVSPGRIVWTFEFEGMPGHATLGIVTFEESGGRTKVTEKSVFESVADRDGMIAAGMEDGGYETMDRLAELVENRKITMNPEPGIPRGRALFVIMLGIMSLTVVMALDSGCIQADSGTGTLTGNVSIGPLCPVEPCTVSHDRLVAAYAARPITISTPSGTTVATVTADPETGYSVSLKPGTYVVDIQHQGIGGSRELPKTLTIQSGGTYRLDISIDTGIR